jgi:hypothetical protein
MKIYSNLPTEHSMADPRMTDFRMTHHRMTKSKSTEHGMTEHRETESRKTMNVQLPAQILKPKYSDIILSTITKRKIFTKI